MSDFHDWLRLGFIVWAVGVATLFWLDPSFAVLPVIVFGLLLWNTAFRDY